MRTKRKGEEMATYPEVWLVHRVTGDEEEAHLIGETMDRRPIYQRVDGYDLRCDPRGPGRWTVDFIEPPHTTDENGNYVLELMD